MLISTLLSVLNPTILSLIALGSVLGVVIGALPGLSVSMAVALLVSLTFGWTMENTMAMICGVYCAGVYGGSISAVLLNIPGAPGAICTGFDGYPMAKLGEAAMGLGLARIGSFIGGLIGVFFLALFAPPLAEVALAFGPMEYLALIVLGLITVGSLSQGSFVKAIIAGLFGLLISCVGMDPIHGIGRFTFGSVDLLSGIGLIPCLIGFFGMSEVIAQLETGSTGKDIVRQMGNVMPRAKHILKMTPLILKSALLGTWIGFLPGVGGSIASFLAYDQAKRTVKNPSRPFGQGAYEGVIAPETANNAMIGGAMIPLMTLGIPGDSVTAIMLGAFMVHGLRPGPLLMTDSAGLFWLIVAMLIVANFMFLFIGLAATRYFPYILLVRKEILMPIVAILCVVGSYAINNSLFDVSVMFATGVLGYAFKLAAVPVGPIVIGIVLGSMADGELRRVSMIAQGDIIGMLLKRPIALVIFAVVLYQILDQIPRVRQGRKMLFVRLFGARRKR